MEKYKYHFIVGVTVIVLALGFWYMKTYARSVPPIRTFSVQGEGEVVTIPDIALISFSILTEGGKDLAALQKENTEKGNAITAFLKENGVEKKDIKTQSYRISPRYQNYSCGSQLIGSAEPCPPSLIVGYSIFQEIVVKVRNLGTAGSLVSEVVAKGANTVSGPSFTIDEPDTLQNEARAKAVANARAKAYVLARAGGFRLGKPISIYEGYATPFPVRFSLLGKGGDMGGEEVLPAPEFEPGSEDIRATVSITYEIR